MGRFIQPFRVYLSIFFKMSIMFLFAVNANSQKVYYDSISKKQYILVDVSKTYEKVINKGYESLEMLEYLGDYYFRRRDYEKSKLYFDRLFEKYQLSQISGKSILQYKILEN